MHRAYAWTVNKSDAHAAAISGVEGMSVTSPKSIMKKRSNISRKRVVNVAMCVKQCDKGGKPCHENRCLILTPEFRHSRHPPWGLLAVCCAILAIVRCILFVHTDYQRPLVFASCGRNCHPQRGQFDCGAPLRMAVPQVDLRRGDDDLITIGGRSGPFIAHQGRGIVKEVETKMAMIQQRQFASPSPMTVSGCPSGAIVNRWCELGMPPLVVISAVSSLRHLHTADYATGRKALQELVKTTSIEEREMTYGRFVEKAGRVVKTFVTEMCERAANYPNLVNLFANLQVMSSANNLFGQLSDEIQKRLRDPNLSAEDICLGDDFLNEPREDSRVAREDIRLSNLDSHFMECRNRNGGSFVKSASPTCPSQGQANGSPIRISFWR